MVEKKKQIILIVDDERANLIVLNDLLKKDYRVIPAMNGAQALKRVKDNLPDLILLDVIMPDMDGYQVCRRLKADELTKDIPIIFVTSLDSQANEERGLLLGALDYIGKPFHPPIVKARVGNILTFVRQRKLLEKLAKLDGLTEIPNRRSFEEALHVEWFRCMRTGSPLSLAMLDIDFFKNYNDNYGHTAGDEALKTVAAVLISNLHRISDTAARYGGEEFVLLLPNTSIEGAIVLAENIGSRVERLYLPHEYSNVCKYLTLSIGGATIVPVSGSTPITLVNNADQMLYEAKKQGRNRIIWQK